MPATEQTWRNQKSMHVVFGVTSLLMLLTTIWMFAKDHAREWKDYQKTQLDIDQFYTAGRVDELRTGDFTVKLAAARTALAEAKAAKVEQEAIAEFKLLERNDAERRKATPYDFAKLDELLAQQDGADLKEAERVKLREKILDVLRDVVRLAKTREDRLLQDKKFANGELTATLSVHAIAIGEGKPKQEIAALQTKVENLEKEVARLTSEHDAANIYRKDLEAVIRHITAATDEAQKNLAALQADIQRYESGIEGYEKKVGRTVLGMPILDAFDNSDTRIEQIWLPDLTINYNFSNVPRFDRCITCHRAIDKTAPGAPADPAYVHEQPPFTVQLSTPTAEEATQLDALLEQEDADLAAARAAAEAAGTPADEGPKLSRDERKLRAAYGMQLAKEGLVKAEDVTIQVVWPKAGEHPARAAEAGLEMADVIVAIGGTPLVTRADAIQELVLAEPWGKTLELTIRRGLPHPYASHPRLDLYMSSVSPHVKGVVGCTVCHDGQGSGTSFKWASHTPNTPEQAAQWRRDHDWFDNHHWIFPMFPQRFIESGCLKCHHDVTELEPSERFPEPPAPKLMAGYNLVREYGCFGCHEINGFDGPARRLGPDMRAEPNFAAVAEALLAEPNLTVQEREWAAELSEHPQRSEVRQRLFEAIVSDKALAAKNASSAPGTDPNWGSRNGSGSGDVGVFSDSPVRLNPLVRLSAGTHKLGDQLKEVETPGKFRKVGPSLRFVASKVGYDFLFDWIRNPRDFRPSTRMPRFFGLWEHLSEHEREGTAKLESIEVRGISEYLLKASTTFNAAAGKNLAAANAAEEAAEEGKKEDAAAPPDGAPAELFTYLEPPSGVTQEASVARGEKLFQTRGCLACHSSGEFPGIHQNQGPDLSQIASKFNTDIGSKWLYSWIRQPTRYHARTKMPDVFLEPITDAEGNVSDPAADIVAYLLTTGLGITVKQDDDKVVVTSVLAGSAASAEPRLRAGDTLESIAGGEGEEPVALAGKSLDEITALLRGKPGSTVRLTVVPAAGDETENSEEEPAPPEPLTLQLTRPGWTPRGVPARNKLTEDERQALYDLSLEHLAKVYPKSVAERYLEDGITDLQLEKIKGDDAVLFGPTKTEEERIAKQIQYVGRRAISKYGCSGCHDIPGFEDAKPIGTGLADWGRKDPTRLAFELITQFLPMHGGHGGDDHASHEAGHEEDGHAADAVPTGSGLTEADLKSQDVQFFLHAIGHHNRQGFLWQKLRQPRSFDFEKVANKGYNERLRMPQFPFDEAEREAVMTFILALVSEPPAAKFIYKPKPRQEAIVKGRRVLEEFNCAGCHTLQMERWDFAYRPDQFGAPPQAPQFPFLNPHATDEQIAASLKTDRRGLRHAVVHGRPAVSETTGQPLVANEEGDTVEPGEEAQAKELFYSFEIWGQSVLDGHVHQTGDPNLSIAGSLATKHPMLGGHLANYLYPHVIADEKVRNPQVKGSEAWGWLPPPLIGQGKKVQTDWLHNFLLEPLPIRPAVVMRMPKFNMSPDDATTLANYFAAVDDAVYPYGYDGRQSSGRLSSLEAAHPNRMQDALGIVVNNTYCVKCHQVADFTPPGSEKAMGPNLAALFNRLRPEFTRNWIANPRRFLPYTGMPVNIPFKPEPPLFGGVAQDIFHGTSIEQLDGLVDFLMNYDRFTSRLFSVKPLVKEPPPAEKPAEEPGQEGEAEEKAAEQPPAQPPVKVTGVSANAGRAAVERQRGEE